MINIHLLAAQGAHSAGQAANGDHVEEGLPHLQNIVGMVSNWTHQAWMANWINVIYSVAIMLIILIFFSSVARNLKKIPDRRQAFVETVFGGLDRFVQDILGPEGRIYVPLLGTIFIYILTMNLFGLIPILGHSPSSSLNITLSLALIIFITVQIHGIRSLGIKNYLKHFADLPEKPVLAQYILAPLMVFLHVIGELAKPVSLSLRLFGNITGEDVLIAVFVMLVAFVPLQVFVYPIALLGSFIQALVFTLLSTVYIMLMSPHKEEH